MNLENELKWEYCDEEEACGDEETAEKCAYIETSWTPITIIDHRNGMYSVGYHDLYRGISFDEPRCKDIMCSLKKLWLQIDERIRELQEVNTDIGTYIDKMESKEKDSE